MVLETHYGDMEAIPEKYRDLYSRSPGGVWEMTGVKGLHTDDEVDALRVRLDKTLAAAERIRKLGLDPDSVERLSTEHERLKQEFGEVSGKLEKYSDRIRRDSIEKALTSAAREKGVRPEAFRDVLARGGGVFTVTPEEKVVLKKDGSELSPVEWLEEELKCSPHWLPASRSGHARPVSCQAGAGASLHTGSPASISDLVNESWNNIRKRK